MVVNGAWWCFGPWQMDLSIIANVCERRFSWIGVQSAIFPSRKNDPSVWRWHPKTVVVVKKFDPCWTIVGMDGSILSVELWILLWIWRHIAVGNRQRGYTEFHIVPVGALHKVTTVLFARFRLAQSFGDFGNGWIAALVRFSYFTNDVSEGGSILGLGSEMSTYERVFDLIPSSRECGSIQQNGTYGSPCRNRPFLHRSANAVLCKLLTSTSPLPINCSFQKESSVPFSRAYQW